MTIRDEYDGLLKSGMFWEFFPELTGSWKEDEDSFTGFIGDRNARFDVDGVDMDEKLSE